ncbi:hypothetical protein L9F63_006594, partial [Diploptera punctata]
RYLHLRTVSPITPTVFNILRWNFACIFNITYQISYLQLERYGHVKRIRNANYG